MSDPIVGIDLGTSNSVVAYAEPAGTVTVLADDAGGKVHPSVVSFHPSGGVVVGAAAKQRKVIDPENTIYSIKRLIGRSYRSAEVQTAKQRSPFTIKEGPNSAPLIATRAGAFAVPEISAIVLDHVRRIAEARLETPVSRAVVTVPASFNDAQRSATATAGAIAGLTVVRVLNEPTAAALAYGHTQKLHEIVAVYDFGGGTFDVTLLRLEDQVYEVLGTSGDTFLGGDDLDERLVERMVAKFLAEHRIDLRTNEVSMMRLRAVAEQTKIELSRRTRAVVRVDEIAYGPRGVPLSFQIELSRDEFVREVADLIDRTFPVCSEALALANLSADRISDVILVGGTTKVPYVREQVARFFGRPPRTDVNPDDAVAMGAALQATALARILARRASSRSMAPERSRRPTGSHPEASPRTASEPARPETSYSVSRPSARDEVSPAAPRPEAAPSAGQASSDDHTPPPWTQSGLQPIGRLMRTAPQEPTPAPRQKTRFGVPAGPAPAEPASRLAAGDVRSSEASQARSITATGTASPPPMPGGPARPKWLPADSAVETIPALEPSAAATARGFSPPQSHPVPPPMHAITPSPAPPRAAPIAPILLEVTPRGLGVATIAGFCEELIRRNARVPAEIKKLFTTSRDQQDLVRIVVCQGESRRLDNNTVIGDLVLQNLPRRPRGETSIEVTFALDPSGVLHVRARDAQTGIEQRAILHLVGDVAQEDVASSRDRLQQLQR